MTKYMLRSGQKKQPLTGSRLVDRNGMKVTENFDIEMTPGEVIDTDDISLDSWVTLGMVDVVYTEEEVEKIEETVIEITEDVIKGRVWTSGYLQVIDEDREKINNDNLFITTSTDGEVVVIEPAVFSSENEPDGEITVSSTTDSDTIEMEKEEDDTNKEVIVNGYKKRGRKSKK